MKKAFIIIITYFVSVLSVFSADLMEIDVVLEEKILEKKENIIGEGRYARTVRDTVSTYLCYDYDTTTMHKAYMKKIFQYFFKEDNTDGILQRRTFHINEVALANQLIFEQFDCEREHPFYNYKFFSKSLYPYRDMNGDDILIVSGYIKCIEFSYPIFPIIYHESSDCFLAKINVTKKELVFLR